MFDKVIYQDLRHLDLKNKEKLKITFFNSGKEKEINLADDVAYMWFWENDHRKSSAIYMAPKVNGDESCKVIKKTPEITKMIREHGARFYTCDDDYEDGDDYRYGYFWPAKEINHDPVDFMEGDGHCHLFVKEKGEYKPV